MPSAALCRNRLRNFLQPWPRHTASRLFLSSSHSVLQQTCRWISFTSCCQSKGSLICQWPIKTVQVYFPFRIGPFLRQACRTGSSPFVRLCCISFLKSGHRSGFGNMCRPALSHLFLRMLKWSLFGLSLLISWRPTRLAKWTGASSPSNLTHCGLSNNYLRHWKIPIQTSLRVCKKARLLGSLRTFLAVGFSFRFRMSRWLQNSLCSCVKKTGKAPGIIRKLWRHWCKRSWRMIGWRRSRWRRLGNDGRTLPSAR